MFTQPGGCSSHRMFTQPGGCLTLIVCLSSPAAARKFRGSSAPWTGVGRSPECAYPVAPRCASFLSSPRGAGLESCHAGRQAAGGRTCKTTRLSKLCMPMGPGPAVSLCSRRSGGARPRCGPGPPLVQPGVGWGAVWCRQGSRDGGDVKGDKSAGELSDAGQTSHRPHKGQSG